jgi:hypothetical protein
MSLAGIFLEEASCQNLAWLQWFRRLVTRYEYPIENSLGFVISPTWCC